MAQHLTEGVRPFGNKGVSELRYLIGRRCMAAPHRRLRSLVTRIVWNELTKLDEKMVPLIGKNGSTYSVWILLSTNQHKFHDRFEAGSL
jgi:hypothetical protein